MGDDSSSRGNQQTDENIEIKSPDLPDGQLLLFQPYNPFIPMAPKDELEESKQTPLHLATVSSNAEAIRILIQQGADPDAREDGTGNTPLHLACKGNRMECAIMLVSIESPQKVKRRSRVLTMLTDISIYRGRLSKDVAQLIVEYLAIPGADWTIKNFAEKTPLDLLESDWDVLQLEMDITKAVNRWKRGELELFFSPEKRRRDVSTETKENDIT